MGLLCITWVTIAFGNSMQPISILAWAAPFVLLLSYDFTRRSFKSSILAHIIIIVVQALGTVFAMAGMLSYPSVTAASLGATFCLGLALATATTLGALLPATRLWRLAADLLPPAPAAAPRGLAPACRASALPLLGRALLVVPLWAYPVMHGGVTTLVGLVLGHDHDQGVAVSDSAPVLQLASLFGLWGLNLLVDAVAAAAFLVAAASERTPLERLQATDGRASTFGGGADSDDDGSVDGPLAAMGLGLMSATSDIGYLYEGARRRAAATAVVMASSGLEGSPHSWARLARPLRRHVAALAAAVVLLLAVGGGLVHSDSFYQRPVTAAVAREQRLAASCVVGQSARVGSADYVWLWAKTAERVAAGDNFVLWAEEAVDVVDDAEEAALLAAGRDLLAAHGGGAEGGGGTYLGLCYQKFGGNLPRGRSTNHFVLLSPNGSVVWDYLKAFPVPVVEAHVIAGPARMPIADSPYGRLSGAICFDLDRPLYTRQAGAARVDLLLQPSWTWGAVGPRHFAANTLRAVENGLTILRCSSAGVSGVLGPRGQVRHYLLTGQRDVLTFELPIQPRVRTLYVLAGWLLEWANLAAAVAMWAALLVPRSYAAQWVRPRGQAGGDRVLAGGMSEDGGDAEEAGGLLGANGGVARGVRGSSPGATLAGLASTGAGASGAGRAGSGVNGAAGPSRGASMWGKLRSVIGTEEAPRTDTEPLLAGGSDGGAAAADVNEGRS
ncbi:hypothetical protein HXX76_004839 [Chlamydomonas incerta]|uniref:CN hydrolase domain-containing protein n=1 Tax=Chlamydomonas incerta TaxID=51695 RepID=A0A835TIN5_CHLIN|nr:hypothetical protein HXX76_004839 [Chlamydomonas incerta]|eukprot:KAG2439485.1 hypothetical protein HXX76_004839 [Chlamydomonas incerta]